MLYSNIICFTGASIALTVAPGPDNLFVLTQGITRGRKTAIVTALGMCSGITVHTTAAALGISAVFYSSAIAFHLVRYLGAGYLLYLAYLTIKNRSSCTISEAENMGTATLFRRGFLMNVLNPKVALFFLAFLPQFVSPHSGHVPLQMLGLGFIFMVQAVAIFAAIGYFSGSIGGILLAHPGMARKFDLVTAGVFTTLGLRLALPDH